ncbi:RBBP9/YdeN family alpha/beta hydrolase [Pseudomonas sp. NPDC089734]|uniref:RBBP9/YdeN family alpha/beta hydrolase n=1 Tax=Pseudomonas sp. NPDC089734 TaxID=3364469 RepID=UPI00382CEADF
MDRSVLIVPGINNSDALHWQTLWQAKHPHWQRLNARDWDQVECEDWVETIEQHVQTLGPDTLIVAHSLGCLAVAHWAARSDHAAHIRGALLVAVPDPASLSFPVSAASGFRHTPAQRFGFPCTVVSSSNDPYATADYTQHWASTRGAEWVDIGAKGHVSSANGLGGWLEGYQLLERLARH